MELTHLEPPNLHLALYPTPINRHRQMVQAKEQNKKGKKGKDSGAAKSTTKKATSKPKASKVREERVIASEGDLSEEEDIY